MKVLRSVCVIALVAFVSLSVSAERAEVGGIGPNEGTPGPKIDFEGQLIEVAGVTAGTTVVIFGVAREPLAGSPAIPAVVVRSQMVVDDDGDGRVVFDLGAPVPALGMWAVVEYGQGGLRQLVASPGFSPRVVNLGRTLVRPDGSGQMRIIEFSFPEIDLFVVRRGVGAWYSYVSKASTLDENRGSGVAALRFDASTLIPIGNSPAGPSIFQRGDLVFLFDRRQFQFGMAEVTQ